MSIPSPDVGHSRHYLCPRLLYCCTSSFSFGLVSGCHHHGNNLLMYICKRSGPFPMSETPFQYTSNNFWYMIWYVIRWYRKSHEKGVKYLLRNEAFILFLEIPVWLHYDSAQLPFLPHNFLFIDSLVVAVPVLIVPHSKQQQKADFSHSCWGINEDDFPVMMTIFSDFVRS